MRKITKITELAITAFNNGDNFIRNNTTVYHTNGITRLSLYGNAIAKREDGILSISDGGWKSKTTKERLNGLHGVDICQKNFIWYLNGKEWDGGWVVID